MRLAALAVLLPLALAGCAAQQQDQATAEQYICADPATRSAKGGQIACEAFYAAYRAPEDPCAGAGNTLECVKLLRGLEAAGFAPNPNAGLIQSLKEPVTLGKETIQGAVNTQVIDMKITQGQTHARVTITTESLFDAVTAGETTTLRVETLSKDIDTQRISPADRRQLEAKQEESVGEVVKLTLDQAGSLTHVSVSKNGGPEFAYDTDDMGPFASLIQSTYHGGQTIRNGDKVLSFDIADLLPDLDPTEGRFVFTGEVIGKSVKQGRPVIVVSVIGQILIDGNLTQGTGTYYIDMATGLALNGEMRLAGLSNGNTSADFHITQSTALP